MFGVRARIRYQGEQREGADEDGFRVWCVNLIDR